MTEESRRCQGCEDAPIGQHTGPHDWERGPKWEISLSRPPFESFSKPGQQAAKEPLELVEEAGLWERQLREWDLTNQDYAPLADFIEQQAQTIEGLRAALQIAADVMEAQDTLLPLHQQRIINEALKPSTNKHQEGEGK